VPIASDTTAPYSVTWDASAVPTANYDLRLVITDNAGNVKTTTPVTVHVNSTAPTVVLTNPGANISGTVPLTASTSGPAAVSVTFQVSPAGANTWQTISVDSASPWSASFDTTSVSDGLYDIRALAVDGFSNQGTDVATNVRDRQHPADDRHVRPARRHRTGDRQLDHLRHERGHHAHRRHARREPDRRPDDHRHARRLRHRRPVPGRTRSPAR
jgi:Protein of unknown function (DUF3607).